LALAAYLFGSLGMTAPAAVLSGGNPGTRLAGCACPDADVRTGLCCCSGKAIARPCCASRRSQPETEQREHGRAGSCCSKQDSGDEPGLRFTSCPCGHSGPDQYLLCGDPRLTADPVQFRLQSEYSDIAAAADTDRERIALRPPTPPPRSIGG
jgi:hypothetical protein